MKKEAVAIWARMLLGMAFLCSSAGAQGGAIQIVQDGRGAVVYNANDEKDSGVVKKALELLDHDLEALGVTPAGKVANWRDATIIAGTAGNSKIMDSLTKSVSWNISQLRNAWDAFEMKMVKNKGKKYLVILGSNDRGTAYGILELSRMMGVSPWAWWADVRPERISHFSIPAGFSLKKQPSVPYRGIFINDEDWGILPWSNKTHDPGSNRHLIGRKTYERVFELVLRLRANTLWPAMHECTTPFYEVDGAREAAREYGIVMGTSHCEPMMRNNAGEWKKDSYGQFNYLTNKRVIQKYWNDRIKDVGNYENFYTIGMRGVHDGRMIGVKNDDEYRTALHTVIEDQRKILTKNLNLPLSKIPQAMVVYKEVLNVYQSGLKVPDDVTLVWCDDNHGYITLLPDEKERNRPGGAGVYYHVSYWGSPHDYLWLATTSPGLLYSEMKRAWDYNARKLLILNVGDIKPAEYLTELFMDMAWDMNGISSESLQKHMIRYWDREMGKGYGEKILPVMAEYYRLNTIRRPEFMGWNKDEINGGVGISEFSDREFGDEAQSRLDMWTDLSQCVLAIKKTLPTEKQDAYFQLVEYPVLASAAMNAKFLYWQKACLYASLNSETSREYLELSRKAYKDIADLTEYYNSKMSNGKWKGIMSMKPRNMSVFQPVPEPEISESGQLLVWLNNQPEPLKPGEEQTMRFNSRDGRPAMITAIAPRAEELQWKVLSKDSWIDVREQKRPVALEKCLLASLGKGWPDAGKGKLSLEIGGQQFDFAVNVSDIVSQEAMDDNQAVAWNASRYIPSKSRNITEVPLMGHSGNVIKLNGTQSRAVYEVDVSGSGEAALLMGFVPNHSPNGEPLICQVQINGGQPGQVTLNAKIKSDDWRTNVLRNQTLKKIPVSISRPGKCTIIVTAPQGAIMLDQLMIDFAKDRKFYEIPALH